MLITERGALALSIAVLVNEMPPAVPFPDAEQYAANKVRGRLTLWLYRMAGVGR